MSDRYIFHPWHGVDIGSQAPARVTAYIEITPSDTVKYELDKSTGLLKVDRPQLYSNVVPALYGFIPQTYCGQKIASLCMDKTGLSGISGDSDPLDILVLSEHRIAQGNILVQALPIGGLRMIDDREADDKIIAVLDQDGMYGSYQDIHELPANIIQKLKHYFLTYKRGTDEVQSIQITHIYGRSEAYEVIEASRIDYQSSFSF